MCSLGSCDYVVSQRLAVERRSQAELLNGVQRSRLAQRVQQLRSSFDRICLIVEKERGRAGGWPCWDQREVGGARKQPHREG